LLPFDPTASEFACFLSQNPVPPSAMSSQRPINQSDITAPTPQNTPLTHAPISAGLSRPTVPVISEDPEPGEEGANVHDAVFGLVQGRLAGLLGKSSGYIESLPDGAKKTIEALKGVQVKQNELQNQYKRECLELEKKVCHLCSDFFYSFISIFYLSTSLLPSIVNTCGIRTTPLSRCGLWGSSLSTLSCLHPSPISSQSHSIRNRE
jgi:hypothetical protein